MHHLPIIVDSSSSNDKNNQVLTKALLRTAEHCGFSGQELSRILGMSEASITRLRNGSKLISSTTKKGDLTKEGELAALLIRLYRSLSAILGDDDYKCRQWLQSENQYFKTTPLNTIQTMAGLHDVVNYLDAMRGKL